MPDLLVTAAVLGTLAGGQAHQFEKREKKLAREASTLPPPPVMPIADDETVQRARRRSLLRQTQRRGRASTILTGEDETLG